MKSQYLQAIGRRKTATAIVRFFPGTEGEILINDKRLKEYFPTLSLQKPVLLPFEITKISPSQKIEVLVRGGGKSAQAEAVRLAISRVLVKFDPNLKPILKEAGFLKRDPREKERKKFGLKRARRAPQWQKR
ncbi:30S ribosomal protein S9 [Candidatus Parcubacteria bacterium]|nr:30S ribosomal protein S9 [Candidatus Parcubacteria bacterium]